MFPLKGYDSETNEERPARSSLLARRAPHPAQEATTASQTSFIDADLSVRLSVRRTLLSRGQINVESSVFIHLQVPQGL